MLIDFQAKPYWVMGVVNITPDSFSDGGQFLQTELAVEHGLNLIAQGADILDLGAESTRPGALPVSVDEELARLLPVLTMLRQKTDIPISIDTSQPAVMQACLAAGASMINDVRALQVSNAAEVLQGHPYVPVCLMHMQGSPQTMQQQPSYHSVVDEVIAFLQTRVEQLSIEPSRIVLDPGFGFGKTLEQNITLFKAIPRLVDLGYPVLIGVSRKTMIGQLTGQQQPQHRLVGSVAAAVEAVRLGAKIVRVHDVRATVDALVVTRALSPTHSFIVDKKEKRMSSKAKKRFFGTDGIRGRVGSEGMTPDMALKLGWAAGMVLKQVSNAPVIIGKDTRISGYMFESALEAGFAAAGVSVKLLGPMPTPAIAYIATTFGAVAGVVISASHNPYYDNGIKFFDGSGRKLSDELELAIEAMMDEPMVCVPSSLLGRVSRISDVAGRYIEFCKSTMAHGHRLNGLKIVVDCANGATYHVAPHVFSELGAEVITIGNGPNGLNINDGFGATDPAALQRSVLREKADLGVALDGDGDRLILVDHTGAILDGDDILFMIMSGQDEPVKGIVGTVMSNMGLENYCREKGIEFHRTPVGDRHVMEKLVSEGLKYGAEPSGHILCLDKIQTGDGIIAALQVLSVMVSRKVGLNALKQGFTRYPQELVNVKLARKLKSIDDVRVSEAISEAETQLGEQGRVLIRLSGTEPLIRIMVEGKDAVMVKQLVTRLEEVVKEVYA